MANSIKAAVGDRVRVLDESDIFEVVGKNRSMVLLRSSRTRKRAQVHYKRVIEVLPREEPTCQEAGSPENASEEASTQHSIDLELDEAEVADESKLSRADLAAEDKLAEMAKTKPEPPRIDLEGYLRTGHEVWVRRMNFDHAHVLAEAWYVVAPDGRKAWSFNTYDRSLGRRQKASVLREHLLADDKALNARRSRLQKKGYSRIPASE